MYRFLCEYSHVFPYDSYSMSFQSKQISETSVWISITRFHGNSNIKLQITTYLTNRGIRLLPPNLGILFLFRGDSEGYGTGGKRGVCLFGPSCLSCPAFTDRVVFRRSTNCLGVCDVPSGINLNVYFHHDFS